MNLKGIDRFDYNLETQFLFVHIFKSTFLLQYKYMFEKKKFEFIKKIDFVHQIDHFVCLARDLYLLVNLSDENSIFSVKKIENNEWKDLEDNDLIMTQLCIKLNSLIKFEQRNFTNIEKILSLIIKLNLALEVRNDLEKNYQSYYKAFVNNMDDYFQRKQERINATCGKRKHTFSNSEIEIEKSKLLVQQK